MLTTLSLVLMGQPFAKAPKPYTAWNCSPESPLLNSVARNGSVSFVWIAAIARIAAPRNWLSTTLA